MTERSTLLNRIVALAWQLLVVALAAGIGMAAAPANAQEVTLRLHTFLPPVANPVNSLQYHVCCWSLWC